MTRRDEIPAFPGSVMQHLSHPGMTLRDYLAAKALPALLAPALTATTHADRIEELMRKVAAAAYEIADMMLAERAK